MWVKVVALEKEVKVEVEEELVIVEQKHLVERVVMGVDPLAVAVRAPESGSDSRKEGLERQWVWHLPLSLAQHMIP